MNSSETDPEFEALLIHLKNNLGCDLTGYKRSTLMRRFRYRMEYLDVQDYQRYLQYLQKYPEERFELLSEILINVTSFFRDQDAWSYLATEIIPQIIAAKKPGEVIRIWSAGCATGQEVYSALILLAEALGIESFLDQVQCFATDRDVSALAQARKATYRESEITGIPPELLEKYFARTDQGYVFNLALRHKIVFGHHNVAEDAPMFKIDLLLCRNVLIYFQPETQISILVRFHFALQKTGFLFLGRSEMFMGQRQIFRTVSAKSKIYAKGLNLQCKDLLLLKPKSNQQQVVNLATCESDFKQAAFENSLIAQFAIGFHGYLISANRQANVLFGLTLDDQQRPFCDLEPGKLIAFGVSSKTFYLNRRTTSVKNIERKTALGIQYLDGAIVPVFNRNEQFLGIILTFVNQTESRQLAAKLQCTDSELARVSQELQGAKSKLEIAEMRIDSAYQEIQILSQDNYHRN